MSPELPIPLCLVAATAAIVAAILPDAHWAHRVLGTLASVAAAAFMWSEHRRVWTIVAFATGLLAISRPSHIPPDWWIPFHGVSAALFVAMALRMKTDRRGRL